jgi:hypothetical protein
MRVSTTQMDVAGVRSVVAATRAALAGLPPADGGEPQVKQGAALLRHEGASPMLATMAERLTETMSELSALVGDVIDATEKAAALVAKTDKAGAAQLRGGVR